MKKSGAIELSIGTIVIVVLAMTMLILGVVLVKNIFSNSTDIVDMSADQIKDQINKMFNVKDKVVVYPDTGHISVKGGEIGGFGLGIQNRLEGSNADTTFSYEVVVSDPKLEDKCGVDAEEIENEWITTGQAEADLNVAVGESVAGKVLIEVPEGAKLCTFRLRVEVTHGNDVPYDSRLMDVTITA